jgi:hypothetical protein
MPRNGADGSLMVCLVRERVRWIQGSEMQVDNCGARDQPGKGQLILSPRASEAKRVVDPSKRQARCAWKTVRLSRKGTRELCWSEAQKVESTKVLS